MLSKFEKEIIFQFERDGWSLQEITQNILDRRSKHIFEALKREVKEYLNDVIPKLVGKTTLLTEADVERRGEIR